MNNSSKEKRLEEVITQIKRAEVKKNSLIKKIFKEYEIYLTLVRESLLVAVEKGIFSIYSKLSITNKVPSSIELVDFLDKNIRLLIYAKLPLVTIEQLKLIDIQDANKELINVNVIKELVRFNENQTINFDENNEFDARETLNFNCKNNFNTYEYYDSFNKDQFSYINLDESDKSIHLSKEKVSKNIHYKNDFPESLLELKEEKNDENLKNIQDNFQCRNYFLQNHDLSFFEFIENSLSNLLCTLSYEINTELYSINLIKECITKDTFRFLSSNNHIIKYPSPFVAKYDLNLNKNFIDNIKSSYIYLFNLNIIELEFYNLDLSICRNNLNELKNQFGLLNKKQKYWENKEVIINNQN